ncbi:MAG: D-alanyl-D-alanine carboxypeptidase family protein [Thermosynechococcaceae cyanobacterium]
MKSLRFLKENWPFIGLTLLTALIVTWAGLTIRTIFSPQASHPPHASPVAAPVPTQIPSWLKTPASLPIPSVLPTAPLPPMGQTPSLPSSAATPTPLPTAKPSVAKAPSVLPQMRYGHLPYAEDPPDRLVSIGTYGSGDYKRTEYLDRDAAAAFSQMVAAAGADGVSIIPISGFRSIADQEKLFERQIQRQGSREAAARLSAPPGYSEHHTGYAVDIGDGNYPAKDVKFEFDTTPAYQWMTAHARTYGFELSFPENNVQGVSFEPWHWRFVQSTHAAAVFSVAHSLRGQPPG